MTTRIWLNASAAESMKPTGKERFDEPEMSFGETGLRVDSDRDSGAKYLNVYGDIMSPTTALPRISHKVIKLVTYEGKIYEGFRTDGLYKARGATLRVETVENIRGDYGNHPLERERYQTISISGGSIRSCQFIYDGVRKGTIQIDSNWGAYKHELPKPDASEQQVH